jgi:translation elongation factor EF-Ts
MSPESKEDLLAQDFIKDPEKTVELLIKSVSGKIGEKMELVRFERMELGN